MTSSSCLKKWYVFYTYPKFERKVHEYLQEESYESFLPLHWIVRQWSDRKKSLQVPLFPNYIFIKVEQNRIFEVIKTPKIINCVKFNKVPASIKQKEIDNIIQIIDNKYPIEVCSNLKVGDSVKITEGALAGMNGFLVEERGKSRFAIRIESLRQSVLVNIPLNYLELNEAFV